MMKNKMVFESTTFDDKGELIASHRDECVASDADIETLIAAFKWFLNGCSYLHTTVDRLVYLKPGARVVQGDTNE